ADDGEGRAVDQRPGDGPGALGVVRVLEDAHGAVPEDGGDVGELRGVQLAAAGADVQAHQVGRDGVRGDDGGVGGGLGPQVRELGGGHDVHGQDELHAALLRALQVAPDGRELVLLEQRGADLVPLG